MTTFRPGDRVHMWQNAWLASTTGTVQGTAADGRIKVRWDSGPGVTPHHPQHLEPAGEPMSTKQHFGNAYGTLKVRENGESGSIYISIDSQGSFAGVGIEEAPALALAILEAAGVKACAKEFGATAGTMAQLEDIAWALADYSNAKALEAEQAADREALEVEALHLCRIMWDNPDQAWTPMSPEAKAKWLKMARTARTLHGVTT